MGMEHGYDSRIGKGWATEYELDAAQDLAWV